MSSEQDTSTYRNNRALFSMRGVVLEQRERTRKSSKADIERFTEESEFKIISLESQIDTLIELRDREHAYVAALRHLISPIHTLPVELLAEIFDLTIRDYTHVQDAHRISQVCSDWRQLVHGTPRLWTRPIQIHLQKRRTDDREQAYLDGLTAWLTRSAPLVVPVSVLADADIYHRMPQHILRTAPRWRSLHFDDVEISFLSHLAEARLDNLEELDLGERNFNLDLHDADDFEKDDLASFTTVPRLQKLRMHNYSDTLSIFVPWAQLTNLILGAHCSNIALDILAQCTNLSQATVSTTGRFSRPEAKQSIPALNHLRVLTLPFFGSAENAGKAMLFLDHLPTPALQKLTLDFGDTVDPRWSEPHFISFQQQAPNITCLELQYSELTSAELIIAIRHVSFLTHLKLAYCYSCFDDTLIDSLSYKHGMNPLAPHLHHLCLDDVSHNFRHDVLVGMIASRWWTDDQLGESRQPPVARWTRVELLNIDFGERDNRLNDLKIPSDVLIY